MSKVVYNACYGGFSLSRKGYERWCELTGVAPRPVDPRLSFDMWSPSVDGEEVSRHDANLVSVVEELGDAANGMCAKLRIDEGSGQYRIDEYDGYESVVWRGNSESEWVTP